MPRPRAQSTTSRAFGYFQAVARVGSIRKAAAALNVASSAVNRKMLELEADLGVPLFERLPRGVRLTSAGELLLQHVRRSAQDFELVRSQIEELRGLRRGHVRLALIEAVAGTVADQVAAFQRGHPLVSFEIAMTGSQEVVAAVVRETADIGYAFNPPPDRRFAVVAEATRSLRALVARGHPLAARERLRLGDCLPYPILLGDETLGGRLLLDQASEATSLALRPVATSNSIAVLQAITAQSNAVCFQIEGGTPLPKGIVALPLADRGLRGRLVLGVARNRSLPVAAAVFLEQLKAELTGT